MSARKIRRPQRLGRLGCLVGVLAVAAAGCRDKTPKPDDARPAAELDALNAVPGDARVVVGLRPQHLASSPVVRHALSAALQRDPTLQRRLERLLSACKVAPARDLAQIIIASGDRPEHVAMIVAGQFEPRALPTCIERAVVATGGRVLQDEAFGGHPVYRAVGGDGRTPVWFSVPVAGLVIAALSQPWLASALGKGPRLSRNQQLFPVFQRVNRGAAVWAVGRVDPAVGQGLLDSAGGAIGAPPRFMFGHLELHEGITAELAAVMADAADAAATASFATAQLATMTLVAQGIGLGPVIGKVTATAQEHTVFLRLALTGAELQEVLSRIDTGAVGE
jgi:hypothetical protein